MRDEDLKNLPQSIERWKFAEMLEALGFGKDAQNNLISLDVDRQGIHARVYATDERGQKYATMVPEDIDVTDLSQEKPSTVQTLRPEAATHEISIPFVGEWKRPDPRPAEQCPHTKWFSAGRARCELEHHHAGDHQGTAGGLNRVWANGPAPMTGMNRCASRPEGEYSALRCDRQAGHGGQHVAWNGQDSDVRWGSNSGAGSDERCRVRRSLGSGGQCILLRGHDGEHRYADRVIGV